MKTKPAITAYPLTWPDDWKRTPKNDTQISRYGDHTLLKARKEVEEQVRIMGGWKLIVSSNIQLRNDGLPRSKQRQPDDKGVAIYFRYHSQDVSFACDKWTTVEDNLWAISLTIDSLRRITRAGASELLERAFRGFAALPAPPGSIWWDVLGVSPQATRDIVRSAYINLAKLYHPDIGGQADKFQEIQAAWEAYNS